MIWVAQWILLSSQVSFVTTIIHQFVLHNYQHPELVYLRSDSFRPQWLKSVNSMPSVNGIWNPVSWYPKLICNRLQESLDSITTAICNSQLSLDFVFQIKMQYKISAGRASSCIPKTSAHQTPCCLLWFRPLFHIKNQTWLVNTT